MLLLAACTEPNPYLPAAEAGSGSSTSMGSDATTLTASSTTQAATQGPESSGSGGASTCAEAGMTCVAAAPAGFAGPFAWLERPADAPLRCPEPFGEPLVEAFSELSAPAAVCDCSCGPLGNADCGPVAVDRHAGVSCGGAVQDTLDLEPGCNVIGGGGWASSTSFFFDTPAVVIGGCLPLPSVERPPAAFLTRHLACAGPVTTAGCLTGELCAPLPDDPFAPRLCVWQEGDAGCPEGSAYAERTLLYRDIDDQRGCEPCTCTVPPGPCDGAVAVLSTAFDCSLNTAAVAPDDCVGGIGGINLQSVLYGEGVPPDACDPAVVVPTGDAAGTEPVTFCCTR
jgi:hypothetical protein